MRRCFKALARDGVTTKYSKGTKIRGDEDLGARRFLAKTLRRKGGIGARRVHHEGKKSTELGSRERRLPANHANIANEEMI
jgi:hypothetical protein